MARRFRDLCFTLGDEMGGPGGFRTLSESRRQLVRRAALLALECEETEGNQALGRRVDLGAYIKASGMLRRLISTLQESRPPPPRLSFEEEQRLDRLARGFNFPLGGDHA